MTSTPHSDQNTDELNAAFESLKLGGISYTDPNGERHDQYPISTNPCGFSFMGQFWVDLGIANQAAEKNATDTFSQTPTDAAKTTDPQVGEIDKMQQVVYQKAVKDRRREKYLPSYGHFLPIKQVPHAEEVSPKKTPSGVRTNDADRTKSDKEIASNDQPKQANHIEEDDPILD